MKKIKLSLLLLVSSFTFSCAQSNEQIELAPLSNNTQVLSSKTAEKWKTVARKKTKTLKKNGGSYQSNLRFEYSGSFFTPASQDVSEFLERFTRDVDDWELQELDNDTFDQLGKRRFNLSIFGPDESKLDAILDKYREHLRSL